MQLCSRLSGRRTFRVPWTCSSHTEPALSSEVSAADETSGTHLGRPGASPSLSQQRQQPSPPPAAGIEGTVSLHSPEDPWSGAKRWNSVSSHHPCSIGDTGPAKACGGTGIVLNLPFWAIPDRYPQIFLQGCALHPLPGCFYRLELPCIPLLGQESLPS